MRLAPRWIAARPLAASAADRDQGGEENERRIAPGGHSGEGPSSDAARVGKRDQPQDHVFPPEGRRT
eukprot:11184481-Lingulodinium_polyedra.AAC.1